MYDSKTSMNRMDGWMLRIINFFFILSFFLSNRSSNIIIVIIDDNEKKTHMMIYANEMKNEYHRHTKGHIFYDHNWWMNEWMDKMHQNRLMAFHTHTQTLRQ